ncbi:fragment of prepilin, shufflon protein (C-ter part) [Escherichia coli]|nr:fragment of prepilin, shufflon protein (C-ter part) [Escherichia coli]
MSLCQSGVWRTIGAPDGSYSNLGSHRGTFNGRNNGRGTLFVYASGGNGAGGGDCANTSNLQGYVNGAFIGMNASNNPPTERQHLFHLPCQWERHIKSSPDQHKITPVVTVFSLCMPIRCESLAGFNNVVECNIFGTHFCGTPLCPVWHTTMMPFQPSATFVIDA